MLIKINNMLNIIENIHSIHNIVKNGDATEIMQYIDFISENSLDHDGVPLLYQLTLRNDRNKILREMLELNFNINALNTYHQEGNSCHQHLCENWIEIYNLFIDNPKNLVYKYEYGDYSHPSVSVIIYKLKNNLYEILFETHKFYDNFLQIETKYEIISNDVEMIIANEDTNGLYIKKQKIVVKAILNPPPETFFTLK